MPFLCLLVPQAPTSHGPNLVRTSWQGSLGTVVCRQTIHAQGGIRPGSEQTRARETPPPPHASRSGPHFKVQLQASSHHEPWWLVPAQPGSQSFRPHSSGPGPLGPCGVRAGSPLSTLPHPRQQLSRPLSQLSKAPQCPSALNSPSALISKKISPPPHPPQRKFPGHFLGEYLSLLHKGNVPKKARHTHVKLLKPSLTSEGEGDGSTEVSLLPEASACIPRARDPGGLQQRERHELHRL